LVRIGRSPRAAQAAPDATPRNTPITRAKRAILGISAQLAAMKAMAAMPSSRAPTTASATEASTRRPCATVSRIAVRFSAGTSPSSIQRSRSRSSLAL
jgi:hypothetical protein